MYPTQMELDSTQMRRTIVVPLRRPKGYWDTPSLPPNGDRCKGKETGSLLQTLKYL